MTHIWVVRRQTVKVTASTLLTSQEVMTTISAKVYPLHVIV